MIAALFYLQYHSIKNRLLTRLRRLKKPKYLAGAIVGALYFYFYFFRWMFIGRRGAPTIPSTEHLAMYESMGALILFVIVLLGWILPKERAALAFSEAEVAFLFPAPISRRGLIHYKLLRSQVGILFTTLFFTLISGRLMAGGHAWIRIAGWWLVLSTLNLHFIGSSFARTMLLERGISNWLRRTVVLGVIALLAVATVVWARRTVPAPQAEDFESLKAISAYQAHVLDSGPAPYVLYLFRLMVRPYLAPDARAFLAALWPVLGLLALHYWWVIRSNVAFEEASVEVSRRIADRMAAARAGRWQAAGKSKKPKRPPFVLRPAGWPAVALLWKNLIAAGQFFSVRFWFLMLWIAFVASIAITSIAKDSGVLPALSLFCLMLLVMALLLGPQIVRQDFRQDLAVADILKMYPIQGWQVALGELLAPTAILTAVQFCLLLLTVVLCSRIPGNTEIALSTRLSIGGGAAVVLPFLNMISLLIPNLAVLSFPSWFQTGKDSAQGIEAAGQRLIFMFGQLLVFLLALIPASILFTVVLFTGKLVTGWVAVVPLASIAAALALGVEAAFGLVLLGRLFERLDLSAEATV